MKCKIWMNSPKFNLKAVKNSSIQPSFERTESWSRPQVFGEFVPDTWYIKTECCCSMFSFNSGLSQLTCTRPSEMYLGPKSFGESAKEFQSEFSDTGNQSEDHVFSKFCWDASPSVLNFFLNLYVMGGWFWNCLNSGC